MEDRFVFLQQVAECGYRWADVKPDGSYLTYTALVIKAEAGDDYRVKRYNPITKYPELYQIFANLIDPQANAELDESAFIRRQNEAKILRFANRYGLLGKMRTMGDMLLWGEQLWHQPAEQYHVWVEECKAMREAIELRQLTEDGTYENLARLNKLIRWTDGTIIYSSPFVRDVLAQMNGRNHWLYEKITPGDVLTAARCLLYQWINSHLQDNASPLLMPQSIHNWDSRLLGVPKGLLGGMWLQLAYIISQEDYFRECKFCHGLFEINPYESDKQNRSTRKYCSNSCRQKAYRERGKNK